MGENIEYINVDNSISQIPANSDSKSTISHRKENITFREVQANANNIKRFDIPDSDIIKGKSFEDFKPLKKSVNDDIEKSKGLYRGARRNKQLEQGLKKSVDGLIDMIEKEKEFKTSPQRRFSSALSYYKNHPDLAKRPVIGVNSNPVGRAPIKKSESPESKMLRSKACKSLQKSIEMIEKGMLGGASGALGGGALGHLLGGPLGAVAGTGLGGLAGNVIEEKVGQKAKKSEKSIEKGKMGGLSGALGGGALGTIIGGPLGGVAGTGLGGLAGNVIEEKLKKPKSTSPVESEEKCSKPFDELSKELVEAGDNVTLDMVKQWQALAGEALKDPEATGRGIKEAGKAVPNIDLKVGPGQKDEPGKKKEETINKSLPFHQNRADAEDLWGGKYGSRDDVVRVHVPKEKGYLQAPKTGHYYTGKRIAMTEGLKTVPEDVLEKAVAEPATTGVDKPKPMTDFGGQSNINNPTLSKVSDLQPSKTDIGN